MVARHNPITTYRIDQDRSDILNLQRHLIERMWAEMPKDQKALMTTKEACEYLDCSRSSMKRWEDRRILVPIIDPKNNYRYYLLGHLWVFKSIWLQDANDPQATR